MSSKSRMFGVFETGGSDEPLAAFTREEDASDWKNGVDARYSHGLSVHPVDAEIAPFTAASNPRPAHQPFTADNRRG